MMLVINIIAWVQRSAVWLCLPACECFKRKTISYQCYSQ